MSATTLMEAPVLIDSPAPVTNTDLLGQRESPSFSGARTVEPGLLYWLGVALVVLLMVGGVSDLFLVATASDDAGHGLVRAAFALTVGPFMLLHCFQVTHRQRP